MRTNQCLLVRGGTTLRTGAIGLANANEGYGSQMNFEFAFGSRFDGRLKSQSAQVRHSVRVIKNGCTRENVKRDVRRPCSAINRGNSEFAKVVDANVVAHAVVALSTAKILIEVTNFDARAFAAA